MPLNIEIKARARDWKKQLAAARSLGRAPERLEQEDTFFACAKGRLKLRVLNGKKAQLIHYERSDRKGPKGSRYSITAVSDAGALRALLSEALGRTKTVRKRRSVFFSGRTRIHFDEVRGLGRFIELEVVLKPGQGRAGGEAEARRLMAALGIRERDLLAGAYADLLGARAAGRGRAGRGARFC